MISWSSRSISSPNRQNPGTKAVRPFLIGDSRLPCLGRAGPEIHDMSMPMGGPWTRSSSNAVSGGF